MRCLACHKEEMNVNSSLTLEVAESVVVALERLQGARDFALDVNLRDWMEDWPTRMTRVELEASAMIVRGFLDQFILIVHST